MAKKQRRQVARGEGRTSRFEWRPYGWALLIAVAGAWAYATSFGGAFVFDDFAAIVENPHGRSVWPISRAMAAPPDTTLAGRPVASLTFALNGAFDSDGQVWGYHAVNLVIHLAAALVLFGVVRRALLGPRLRARFGGSATALAGATAILWVVHPLNTEAVTYIVQRVESLMGLFALLSVYCAVRAASVGQNFSRGNTAPSAPHQGLRPSVGQGLRSSVGQGLDSSVGQGLDSSVGQGLGSSVGQGLGSSVGQGLGSSVGQGFSPDKPSLSPVGQGPSSGNELAPATRATHLWSAASLTAYALALGSKEAAVAVPFIIIAWDVLFSRTRWRLYAGYAAATAILLITVPGARTKSVGFWLDGWTPWSYLLTQSRVLVHYLRLAFWPSPLILDPYWPAVRSLPSVMWPFTAMTLLFALTIAGLAKRYAVAFAGVCFFAMLAPTSSILPITTEVAAEHRMYLPLAALLSVVVVGCYTAARHLPVRATASIGLSALAVVVLLLGAQTRDRNRDYASDEQIWRDTIAKQPDNPRARMALGADLVIAGRYEEAVNELEASLAIDPARPETLSNLGLAELKLGRVEASIGHLERAVALRPEYAAAHRNLAQAYLARHQDRLAARHFRRALEGQPDHAPTLKDLGLLLAVTSDGDLRNGIEALALAERAVALTSRRDPASLTALAAALAELDRFDDAVAVVREAAALPTVTSGIAGQLSRMLEAYSAHERIRRPSR